MKLAGCIIQNQAGEILLIHRNTPELQQWELPGGKAKPGEEGLAAAQREVAEEIGVIVRGLKEVGETTFEQGGVNYEYLWFRAEIVEGNPRPLEDKHDKIGYFPVSLMVSEEFSPNVRLLAKKLQEQVYNGQA